MDEWLQIVIRQLILYALPVLVSLTLVVLLESKRCRKELPHPFFAISGRAVWMPLLASIILHRGMVIAPPNYLTPGVKAATVRLFAHILLCAVGLLLYGWSLSHQPPAGLPPLHHWWAKVLMFFNLCMAALHLLPLPGMLVGEWLVTTAAGQWMRHFDLSRSGWLVWTVLAASPLLDLFPGGVVVFPVYESLSSRAATLF